MGEDATHQRLKRKKGKASEHLCVECGKPAFEWAFQHGGKDPEDIESYAPMCRSCHRKLDHRESPVLKTAWSRSRSEGTPEGRSKGGKNTRHPGRKFTHEEAVAMGRKGGLAKAANSKKG